MPTLAFFGSTTIEGIEERAMHVSTFPELGFYLLPGHAREPRHLLDEARRGEALGFGSAWISERFDVKEAAVCTGAAGAVTERITIGTAATNVNTRHPIVTASMATTAHRLTGGRFALGVARGVAIRSDLMGLAKVSDAHLRDFVDVMKKLFRGERVMGYDGPLGDLPYLHTSDWLDEDIPILFAGFGPKSLEAAGGIFDGVILHTFLGDDALRRSVQLVRRGAEGARRDPASVRVWAVLATLSDPTEEDCLRGLVARMATYMQAPGYGELLAAANGWDPEVLARFRASDLVAGRMSGIDGSASLEELAQVRALVPEEWLPAAVGTPDQCAKRIDDQFAAGADGVILHASTPDALAPVLDAYARIRRPERFEGRTNRPA